MGNEEQKHYLRISLKNHKNDNRQGAWSTIRSAVSPWYQNGLTDDYLQDSLKQGGSVEIAFNPTGQREKAIDSLSNSQFDFTLEVYNK